MGQGSGRHLSRSVRINSNPADPALWKENWARRARIINSKKLSFILQQSIAPRNSWIGNQDECNQIDHAENQEASVSVGLALTYLIRF